MAFEALFGGVRDKRPFGIAADKELKSPAAAAEIRHRPPGRRITFVDEQRDRP
jgi:hypothetical protein